MSNYYRWRPVMPIPPNGDFGSMMRNALIARGEQAGLYDPSNLDGLVLGPDDLEWLRGVRDSCGTPGFVLRKDATDLINAITAQGAVRIEVAIDESDGMQEPFTDEPF